MLDEIRNHDAVPTEEEREWIDSDPLDGFSRALIIGGIAMLLGVTVSYLLEPDAQPSVASLQASHAH